MKDLQSFQTAFNALFKSFLCAGFLCGALFGASTESEHPPLSADTKKAIAAYKHSPTEANKANLLNALNQSYDKVIAQKQEKLATREKERDKKINAWLKAVKSGKNPPFMNLQTPNKKGNERQVVANAISAYQQNANSQNEKALKEALNAYYDAFLNEQRAHIKETQDLREERIQASLERFTSESFDISVKKRGKFDKRVKAEPSEFLAEIIAAYFNAGAQIVPVNPDARVRERELNAQINTAQKAYLTDKSEANKANLRAQIQKAFETAYNARFAEFKKAENKGLKGAKALYDKMQDSEFIAAQFKELSEQRNLYGRIDRRVSFETSFGALSPRLKEQSNALYEALQQNDKVHSQELFNALYEKMLALQKEHLNATQNKLESFVDEVLAELTKENKREKRKAKR